MEVGNKCCSHSITLKFTGSFWTGSNQEITTTPDALVIQSIENKLPVMHVAMNYRLGGMQPQ